MSLRDEFRENLFDSEHKPRLSFARNYFLEFSVDKDLDFEELQKFYVDWRDFIEYMVVQKQTDNLRVKGAVEKETIAVKCAKRGNDVYWWRVGKRLKFLHSLKDSSLFDPHSSIKQSNVLFATLTYDVKRARIREAWETIGDDFNNWIRNLRKKFGRISYLRCWEASRRGYPHIHVVMIFHDDQFQVALIRGKFRIVEKEAFERSYHSFVDVQAVREVRKGVRYITKYLTKTQTESKTKNLTQALCWLFRKQSFAVSGDFHERLYTMIHTKHQLIQTDLFGHEVEVKVVWVFIGIFPADKLGITHNEWWKPITDRQILNEILT